MQRQLRAELRAIPRRFRSDPPNNSPELPLPESLESLRMLGAVIKESLRLRNTVPTANPRNTPSDRKTAIGPYTGIPPGVRISCFAWCLHRNDAVYADPEEWRPERWLFDSPHLEDMEKWFWTWGSGRRACVGQNLAMESKFEVSSRALQSCSA